jgi:hypothetical protein
VHGGTPPEALPSIECPLVMFIIAYLHQVCHLTAIGVPCQLAYIVFISFIKLIIMGTFCLTFFASISNVNV